MIKYTIKEYCENQLAIRETKVKFLGINIYTFKGTSTRAEVVAQLTSTEPRIKVKGYTHETKNKSKKTK